MHRKFIIKEDLPFIACGATILGSGGGGDPAHDLLLAQYFMDQYGDVEILDLQDLDNGALVVPIAFMGSPQVSMEMLANGNEFDQIFDAIVDHFQRPIKALVALEIGGSNCFAPLIACAKTRIPLVDADTLGRAFPELHMSSCTLFEVPCSPCFIADNIGNMCMIYEPDAKKLERKARKVCLEMGSSAAVSVSIMDGNTAKRALIPNTMSRALHLGRAACARDVYTLQEAFGFKSLFTGCVVDIESKNDRGFLEGKIVIQNNDACVEIFFQNEYLFATCDNQALAYTPDIISLFEEEHFIPLAVETVKYGMHIVVAQLPAPEIWKTEQGLALVGPKAFGYTI